MAASRSTDAPNVTQRLLVKANAGDDALREQLFRHCCERLERLARRMLADFPAVRRWEQTDDVFQNAAMRLTRSLQDVKPESVRHFYALAATQIRRQAKRGQALFRYWQMLDAQTMLAPLFY